MSLLDKGNADITIYRQTTGTDADGNVVTKADWDNPIKARAMIQLQSQSGTSARRAEQDSEGFESEEVYRLRLTRADDRRLGELGPQSIIYWRDKRWSLIGFAGRFNGSRRTAHNDYTIRRTAGGEAGDSPEAVAARG